MKADCPVHGPQEFIRDEPAAWWVCPYRVDHGYRTATSERRHAGMESECDSVICDEDVTPDGADVEHFLLREIRRLSR